MTTSTLVSQFELLAAIPETEQERVALAEPRPRVVAIGGGHGLAVTLKALQKYAGSITAVVSVADDGGSSGRLKEGLGIPPPGDIRRCLLALTPDSSLFSELFEYRFAQADVGGHALGNLILAAFADLLGSFEAAVLAAGGLLGAVGAVVPAADRATHLTAVVGGRRVAGQGAITQARGGVESLTIGPPEAVAPPRAVESIRRADQVVIGPGSLFTSVMAVLLVPGLAEAVRESEGEKIFVLNLIDQDGETLGLTGEDHLERMASLVGVTGPGTVIAHHGAVEVPDGHQAVTLAVDGPVAHQWRLVPADVAIDGSGWPEHDPAKLGATLENLWRQSPGFLANGDR